MKDYKDLIAKLRGTKTQSKRKLLDDAADAIEHLQRQLAHKQDVLKQQAETIMDLRRERSMGEWISVKERLPVVPDEELEDYVKDKGYPFLVATEDGCVEVQSFWAKERCFDYADVTHWMPLPPAPKEG